MPHFARHALCALRRLAAPAALAAALASAAGAAQAESRTPTEYDVKAAFLYNFARFVEWPDVGAVPSVDVCVVGADPFGSALDAIKGKPLGRATLRVRRAEPDKLGGCELVFIPASESGRLESVLQAVKGRALLTVGDGPDFAQRGAVIGFYPDQSKVRFEINIDAARRSGLAISSQLLRLARITHDRNATQ